MSTSSSIAKPKFNRGVEIAGWKLIRQIGSGGFGTVHEVEKNGVKAAMKAEFTEDQETLRNEVLMLRILQHSPHFCRLFTACKVHLDEKDMNIMVMTLVGRSLSTFRRQCPGGKFSQDTAIRVARQCLQALEDMHSVGVIHRDIKGANFAWNDGDRRIYLLDLGFCRKFVDVDEDGVGIHRKPRKNCHFLGTAKYCSLTAHDRKEQSRRDDLWCWFYMSLEFYLGRLPWATDSDFRTALKKRTIGSKLLKNCPKEMYPIYDHVRFLEYESKPNYRMLQKKLDEFLDRKNVTESFPYDWEKGGRHYEVIKKKLSEKKKEETEEEEDEEEESSETGTTGSSDEGTTTDGSAVLTTEGSSEYN